MMVILSFSILACSAIGIFGAIAITLSSVGFAPHQPVPERCYSAIVVGTGKYSRSK